MGGSGSGMRAMLRVVQLVHSLASLSAAGRWRTELPAAPSQPQLTSPACLQPADFFSSIYYQVMPYYLRAPDGRLSLLRCRVAC